VFCPMLSQQRDVTPTAIRNRQQPGRRAGVMLTDRS
jgi:hypothetical protein